MVSNAGAPLYSLYSRRFEICSLVSPREDWSSIRPTTCGFHKISVTLQLATPTAIFASLELSVTFGCKRGVPRDNAAVSLKTKNHRLPSGSSFNFCRLDRLPLPRSILRDTLALNGCRRCLINLFYTTRVIHSQDSQDKHSRQSESGTEQGTTKKQENKENSSEIPEVAPSVKQPS